MVTPGEKSCAVCVQKKDLASCFPSHKTIWHPQLSNRSAFTCLSPGLLPACRHYFASSNTEFRVLLYYLVPCYHDTNSISLQISFVLTTLNKPHTCSKVHLLAAHPSFAAFPWIHSPVEGCNSHQRFPSSNQWCIQKRTGSNSFYSSLIFWKTFSFFLYGFMFAPWQAFARPALCSLSKTLLPKQSDNWKAAWCLGEPKAKTRDLSTSLYLLLSDKIRED